MRRHLCALLALCFASLSSFAAITGVVMTGDGQPISGARVSVRAFESSEAMRTRLLSAAPEAVPLTSAQTDSKGTFSLESPKEPTVELNIFARGYEPVSRGIERDEEVGAVVLQKAETRKGSITAAGKPVPNALVVVSYGGYEYATRTDESGRYEAPDPKRARSLIIVHPDFAVMDERFMTPAGVNASALNRVLAPGNAFKGTVVSGEPAAPAAKATVFVDGWPLATTGDDGTFTIAHMPLRWTTLTARKDNLLGQRAFTKESSATIKLAKAATISGRITDAKTRVPVAGAVVRVGPRRFGPGPDTSASTLSDAKGAYSLIVPAGTYMVLATHPGYDMRPVDANAVAGQQTSKDVALSPLARVSGVVLDEAKRPVVVAVVDTENAENERFGGGMRMMRGDAQTVSGPDGRFSMRVQPEQEMFARATKRGFPAGKSDTFSVAAGERKTGMVLTIPSGIAVSGRAIDVNGDPLSGVAVTAAEAEGGQRMMFRSIIGGPAADDDAVRTGSDGTFTMRVKEGTYDFTFRREDLAPKIVRGQNVSVASSPNVEATMEPAAEISGRVTRAGAGLENVMIMAMVPGTSGNSTVTGPDGSFTLGGLPAGSVRIMARKMDDFINEQRNVTAPARDVVIDVRPGGRISGRVVEKGSGKPITTFDAGITTSRGGPGGGMVMMGPPQTKNFTSEDGSFTLEAVPAGAMVLMASSPGYASARLNVNVEEGKEITGVELQLDAGVKLTGRVTGANGAALSDVQVRVLPSPTGSFATRGMDTSAITDANGEYAIDGLEAGEETVSFSHPKHSSAQKQVTLKGRETRLDMQLSSGGRLSGTVVTESGAPVADAQVQASSSGGFESARTNANGAFELDSVAPGRYHFRASKSGFVEGTLDDVDVTSGTPVRIVMKTGGTIYGHITGLTAQELAQTQVEASSGRTSASGTVDASGNYRVEGVAAGTVRLDAWSGVAFGGSSRRAPTQTVELAAGGSQQIDIAFRGDIVVSGRVIRNGAPVIGGQVNFYPRGSSTRGSGSSAIESDGRYSVSGLEDGEYNITVIDSQRGSTPYQTTYQVRGTATHDIEYKTNLLRGRVIDRATSEPLANVTVSLRPSSSASTDGPRFSRSGLSDATGAFIIDAVPAGNYQATATKEGFGNESKDLYVTDSSLPELEFQLSSNPGVKLTVLDERDNRPITARAVAFDMQGRVADETRMMFGGGGDPSAVTLNVAPGTYTVTVSASGYAPRQLSIQSPANQTIRLSPGGTIEVLSKHNEPLRIRLIDANGLPYPRYSIALPTRELLPGTNKLNNVAAGRYTLQLLNGESVVDAKQLVVVEGQTVREEI
ncbi:MAG: carboxypeptidase regulatory-like domain-containing protein [Thermoanaerobaculia bacterium]